MMSFDPKFDAAKKLIDKFAVQLLALNYGEKIPRTWKNHLLRAITKTEPGKPGGKPDYDEVTKIAKQIYLRRKEFFEGELTIPRRRTKHHSPAKAAKEIAAELGIHPRTVRRRVNNIEGIKSTVAEWRRVGPEFNKTKERKMFDAVLAGIAAGYQEEMQTETEQEDKARQQIEARRRNQKLPPAK